MANGTVIDEMERRPRARFLGTCCDPAELVAATAAYIASARVELAKLEQAIAIGRVEAANRAAWTLSADIEDLVVKTARATDEQSRHFAPPSLPDLRAVSFEDIEPIGDIPSPEDIPAGYLVYLAEGARNGLRYVGLTSMSLDERAKCHRYSPTANMIRVTDGRDPRSACRWKGLQVVPCSGHGLDCERLWAEAVGAPRWRDFTNVREAR